LQHLLCHLISGKVQARTRGTPEKDYGETCVETANTFSNSACACERVWESVRVSAIERVRVRVRAKMS
jgi:hypothetical protein